MIEGTLEDFYPDVLGAITGGVRVSLGAMQVALGVFPKQAYLNQPIEAVKELQISRDMDPTVAATSFQLGLAHLALKQNDEAAQARAGRDRTRESTA